MGHFKHVYNILDMVGVESMHVYIYIYILDICESHLFHLSIHKYICIYELYTCSGYPLYHLQHIPFIHLIPWPGGNQELWDQVVVSSSAVVKCEEIPPIKTIQLWNNYHRIINMEKCIIEWY